MLVTASRQLAHQTSVHVLQIDKCFGFDTAVEEAQTALLAAKVEASSADQGIGLVKLMGRSSGFIAMQASMASGYQPHPSPFTCWLIIFDWPGIFGFARLLCVSALLMHAAVLFVSSNPFCHSSIVYLKYAIDSQRQTA